MKYLYKYPQAPYPYRNIVETNRRRARTEMEYELIDKGGARGIGGSPFGKDFNDIFSVRVPAIRPAGPSSLPRSSSFTAFWISNGTLRRASRIVS